jgi:hypothetical protein
MYGPCGALSGWLVALSTPILMFAFAIAFM